MGPSCTMRPWSITTTRSATSATSARMWLEISTAPPLSANDRRKLRNHATPAGSSPFAGSSRTRTSGSPSSAAESASRCFIPSENLPTRPDANVVMPVASSARSTPPVPRPPWIATTRRWLRAVRPGWKPVSSKEAPTRPSGRSSAT